MNRFLLVLLGALIAMPAQAQTVFKSPSGEVFARNAAIAVTTNAWVTQPNQKSDACGVVLVNVDLAKVKQVEISPLDRTVPVLKFTLTEQDLSQFNRNRDTLPACLNGVRQPTQKQQNPVRSFFYADGKLAILTAARMVVDVQVRYAVDQTKSIEPKACGITRIKNPLPDAKFNGAALSALPTQSPPLCKKGVLYLPVAP